MVDGSQMTVKANCINCQLPIGKLPNDLSPNKGKIGEMIGAAV